MDDPALAGAEHERALAGLARINALSAADAAMWRELRTLIAGDGGAVSTLDVATGSADVLLGMWRRAAHAGVRLDLSACDISARALGVAAARLRAGGASVRTMAADVTGSIPLDDRGVDVACCSLFLHHLSAEHTVRVLAEMARVSRLGVVVLDLRRCTTGLVAAASVPRLLTRSRVVHVDAVRSVRAAWTPDELRSIAERAGLAGATVRRVWPWRMTLRWQRPGAPPPRAKGSTRER